MPSNTVTKRQRHVSVKNLDHVYKSQRSDGSWHYEVQWPKQTDGKRPYETICPVNRKGARALVIERRSEIFGSGTKSKSKDPHETLEQAVEHWRADCTGPNDLKPRSVEMYEGHIVRLKSSPLWKTKVRDIEWTDIKRWLDGLKRRDGAPLADSTKRGALATIDVILEYARSRGILSVTPKIPRGKKPKTSTQRDRVLTREEDDRLAAAFGRRGWMLQVYDVALGQALRLGEVTGLQWSDIDFEAGTVTIQRQIGKNGEVGTPKNGEIGTIDLTERAARALLALRKEAMAEGRMPIGPVFLNTLGERLDRSLIERAFSEAVKTAGIEHISMHGLRHTMISWMFLAGVAPTSIQRFARHKVLATTLGYAHHVKDEAQSDRIRKVGVAA